MDTRNDSPSPPRRIVLSAHPEALDLLKDFAELTRCLGDAASAGSSDDAFLFAAGLHQIVEDWLRDPWSFSVVRKRARRHGLLGAAGDRIGAAAMRFATTRRRRSGIVEWEESLRALVLELGDAIVDRGRLGSEVARRVDQLVRSAPSDARLAREVARIPSCFRSFDVRPDDVAALMERFAERSPDRALPLAVLGVRTSGSYLAPLAAAVLRRLGYDDVIVRTVRPAELDDRRLARELRAVAARDGHVLVLDDPPNTGGSFRAVARWLAASGVPREAVVSVAPLFTDSPPATLGEGIWLPWSEWSIHRHLDAASTREALEDLWQGQGDVLSVEPLRAPVATAERRHARALFRVSVRDGGGIRERLVYAKGAGYGYFATHAVEVARRLDAHVPQVVGLVDGVLLREWLRDETRAAGALSSDQLSRGVAGYVLARERALAVPEDRSVRLFGRGTAWRRAAEIVARAHGSAAAVALPAVARVARRLLAVEHPSIVDGTMESARWFVNPERAGLLKVSADHRAFASRELYCYDSRFDLAGAAAGGHEALASSLRHEYARAGGSEISDERWLLYMLVHLDAVRRDRPDLVQETRRRMSLALQRYLSSTVFADTRAPSDGPLCALDVDGVLETGELEFPALAPVAAFALRALARHGWRPLIVTGRSGDEVRSRCAAYPLAGGVAEYGAVLVDATSGRTTTLLSDSQAADMTDLRQRVAALSGVLIDPAFGSVVRAYRLDAGRRGGMNEADIAAVTSGDTRSEVVRGKSQTDLRPRGVDKASGVRALAMALGATSDRPLAFAVGDSASDLAMFALAERAYVPSNAAELRSSTVRVTGAPYAGGFARAVATELGHAVGGCAVCARPALSSDAALLLGALDAQGQGRFGKLRATAALLARAARL